MKNDVVFSRQEILDILDIARLAPSVHNTQAWFVTITDAIVIIGIDEQHVLSDGDPTGRQTIISLGIFCEAFRLVALEKGLQTTKLSFKHRQATLKLRRIPSKKLIKTPTIELLGGRGSDRSIYRPATISETDIRTLETTPKGLKTHVHVIVDESLLQAIAELTSHGIALALSNPSFRRELSHYLVLPGSQKKRGIAVKSLYISRLLTYVEPLFMRLGIGLQAEADLEKKRWLSASAVIVLTADGDLAPYWFDAGQAYLRASLAIERLGLAQATSAAIVEASNYHEDVEAMLGTNRRILSLVRVGKGSKIRHHSPRVDSNDILRS
jgi:hypothetical protein